MRKSLTTLSSLAAFTLASLPAVAASPEVERVIERPWHGMVSAPADWVEGGQLRIEERLHLDVDASDDISGSADASFTLDGVLYEARYSVSGRYDGRDGLRLKSSLVRGDTLPGDLHWCGSSGNLTIYRDADHDGYYLLKGSYSSDCGGTSDAEYTDRL